MIIIIYSYIQFTLHNQSYIYIYDIFRLKTPNFYASILYSCQWGGLEKHIVIYKFSLKLQE